MPIDFQKIWHRLDDTLKEQDFKGWDPFDGLNSRLFQMTPLTKSRWARLAWLQLFKRMPVNFRPLVFIPKVENSKAIALLARSYLLTGDEKTGSYCLDRLLSLRSDMADWGDAAWGYPFDWQAKAFFVPKGTPNVICTLYAVLALEAEERFGQTGDVTPYIRQSAEFVMKHLRRSNEQGEYIAYVPESKALVYNASLWGAYILTTAWRRTRDETYLKVARAAIDNVLDAQEGDGKWRYGTLPHHQFVDGFHTGYVLEALHRCNLILEDERIGAAIQKGLDFYLEHFIDHKGRAAYYSDSLYPIDPHSAAQMVITLSLLKPEGYRELQRKILLFVCETMWNEPGGYFHYQEHRFYQNSNNYLRWTQAWMHLALSKYLREQNQR